MLSINVSIPCGIGSNDDVTKLNIELEFILERQLISIIFFYDFYFKDEIKQINLKLVLERLLKML
jgi:hypothetical protein